MFQTAPGVSIPFPEKIEEGFTRYSHGFMCNISFEKLEPLVKEFYRGLDDPVFLAIHIPLNQHEEKRFRGAAKEHFHDEVLYLDGCSVGQIDLIMQAYGEILFCDGMSKFAVASHVSKDEIFIEKYKLVYIMSENSDKYIPLLNKYGIIEKETLDTVWKTFLPEYPGECRRIRIKGKDIYYVVKKLREQGMYTGKIDDA
jgi:hypothetical protein